MNRRGFLTVITVSVAGFAGCLDDTDAESGNAEHGDSRESTDTERAHSVEYEQCGKRIIPIRELPEPAKEEVMVALEEGEYESEESAILPNVLDIDESYLSSDDDSFRFYRVVVEEDEAVTRLYLKSEYPSTSATASISNALEDDVTVDVHIGYETTDEVLVSETIELKADEEVEFNGDVEYRYGRYNADLTVTKNGSEKSETVSWTINEHREPYSNFIIQTFSEEDMLSKVGGVHYHPLPCEWNNDGKLVEGRTA